MGTCGCHGSPHRPRARRTRIVGVEHMSRRREPVPSQARSYTLAAKMRGGTFVLNFYSAVFIDQLKRGRKTATIRLGDKSGKYERGQVVWVTVGFRHSPREKIFTAVIDDVEVKPLGELSRARHRARQPRVPPPRGDDQVPRADLQPADLRGRRRHRDPLLADRRAAAGAPRQRGDPAPQLAWRRRGGADGRLRVPHHLAARVPAPAGLGGDPRPGALAASGGAGWRRPRS